MVLVSEVVNLGNVIISVCWSLGRAGELFIQGEGRGLRIQTQIVGLQLCSSKSWTQMAMNVWDYIKFCDVHPKFHLAHKQRLIFPLR